MIPGAVSEEPGEMFQDYYMALIPMGSKAEHFM